MTDAPPPSPTTAPAPTTAPPPPPELAGPTEAFERGDFRAARQQLDALLASKPAPQVEAAARALEARIAPDPWALRFGILAFLLLGLVVGLYVR